MRSVCLIVEWENANSFPSEAASANVERLAGQVAGTAGRSNARFLIIVVYDPEMSSAVGAERLCDRLSANHGHVIDVRPLALRGGGYVGQKVAGIHAEPAEIYVFADCDCNYADDWFDAILAPLLSGEADYAYGRNIMDTSTVWGCAAAVYWFYPLESDVPDGPREPFFSNLALTRTAYARYPFLRDPGDREACAMWSSTVKQVPLRGKRLLVKVLHPPPAVAFGDLARHAMTYGRIDDALASARGRSRVGRIRLATSRLFWRLVRIPARLVLVGRIGRAGPTQRLAMAGLSVLYVVTTTLSQLGWALAATHRKPTPDPDANRLTTPQN